MAAVCPAGQPSLASATHNRAPPQLAKTSAARPAEVERATEQ
jgi:hypothetical protein